MANVLGMYSVNNTNSIEGVDYPGISGWPKGYVPIPVHTVHRPDYMAKELEEVKTYLSQDRVSRKKLEPTLDGVH
ncbi:unnamed protein product [Strongylus vulgaris]|uniref:Uncharacterized protein n=1 Tax=Strongylus vulgaris TaxID=40348 RepID=A0A3P7LWW9_STRVU|nr:unnamed protein product [Strongylus vulgaris]